VAARSTKIGPTGRSGPTPLSLYSMRYTLTPTSSGSARSGSRGRGGRRSNPTGNIPA
jgi:hypothetical protein